MQAKDAIISAKQPCTFDEAIDVRPYRCVVAHACISPYLQLAALLLQAEHGDYYSERHKPGFIDDLRTILPAEYTKTKHVEKQVYALHRKLIGTSNIDAKIRYVRRSRGIKTFGITFFSVKEQLPGKQKLQGRLLGVSREAVLRVDEATKDFLKIWPLTTVRRWAATASTFIIDFGGFEDAYLSVQTSQGQELSQLIAEYIDVILNQKKQHDRRSVHGNAAVRLHTCLDSSYTNHISPPGQVARRFAQGQHSGRVQ